MLAPARVACFRTDRLGDLVLAMPAMAALARALPSGTVTAVVAPRNVELLAGQPWVGAVFGWEPARGLGALRRFLRERRFDAAVLLYPRLGAALAALAAGVPIRVGTSTRWYASLFNRRLRVHRSENLRHEAAYNFDLLAPWGVTAPTAPALVAPLVPYAAREAGTALLAGGGVSGPYVVVHPGSGGSALNAGPRHYGVIAHAVEAAGLAVVFTGTQGERGRLAEAAAAAGLGPERMLFPPSLMTLAAVLAGARAVIGSSTGPVHLAAALGVHVVALFPPLHAQQPVRWRPWTDRGTVLVPHAAICPSCLLGACPLYNCLERIPAMDVATAALGAAR